MRRLDQRLCVNKPWKKQVVVVKDYIVDISKMFLSWALGSSSLGLPVIVARADLLVSICTRRHT